MLAVPEPDALFAAFPRGEGFYFDPLKLALVVVAYLAWVRTCWRVDRDCREVGLPGARWNAALLAAGALGLLLVWALPIFWASFVVLVALFLAPTLVYVGKRNEKVSEEQKVLTQRHLRKVMRRLLGGKKAEAGEKKKPIPIRFIGKTADKRGEDATRV